jgi:hypothetical protein
MTGQVETAHELAVQALRFPAWLSDVVRGAAPDAVAATALEHAEDVTAAARAAAAPVDGPTGIGAAHAAAFGELVAATVFPGPVLARPVPVDSAPDEAAAWWASLSAGAQLAVVRAAPEAVGALDGLPAWARDRSNRLVLDRALRDPATPDTAATARTISRRIAAEEARGQQVQLQLLDLAGDRVVLALGDLDTADAVAVLVPGMATSPSDDLGRLTGDAEDVAAAARAAAPGLGVATVVWLGYRTPGNVVTAGWRGAASRGGVALDRALDGLSAARASIGTTRPRTTVLAHSYGTAVVDEAADAAGRLAADAVVLLGSPGMEGTADDLEAPEVFDAVAPSDFVGALGYYGNTVDGETFGATALPVEFWSGHSGYFDTDRPTLAAMGEVVAGVRAD